MSLVPQNEITNLVFEGLTLQHEGRPPVLQSVDFDFPLNGVLQIHGAVGSGVSSVLQLLAGILEPKGGKVLLNGQSVHDLSQVEFLPFQLAIGYASDIGGLISHFSLLENLMLPLSFHSDISRKASEDRACEYLERFGIFDSRLLRPGMVSSGTRKGCALARAFILNPKMVLLDEPTQGLNRAGVERLVDFIEWHHSEHGLKHVVLGTEDEFLLSHFQHQSIEIVEHKLRVSDERVGHAGSL